jgi:hypothetical protein
VSKEAFDMSSTPRIPRTVSLTAALAVAAAAVVTTGVGTAHADKSCGFEFTFSKPSVYPPAIKGNGIANCEVPPTQHHLTLSLEYKQSGTWYNAATITDKTIPPAPPRTRPYEVSATCYAGTWRVSMAVTGMMAGNPFAFSDYSKTRDVPTSQCPSR